MSQNRRVLVTESEEPQQNSESSVVETKRKQLLLLTKQSKAFQAEAFSMKKKLAVNDAVSNKKIQLCEQIVNDKNKRIQELTAELVLLKNELIVKSKKKLSSSEVDKELKELFEEGERANKSFDSDVKRMLKERESEIEEFHKRLSKF